MQGSCACSRCPDRSDDFAKGMEEANALGHHARAAAGQIHSLKDLMMPALIRAGLVTPRRLERCSSKRASRSMPTRPSSISMEDQKSDMNVLNAAGAKY